MTGSFPGDRRPVVVVTGLPRSGTSMLMGMLSAGGLEVVEDDHRPSDPSNPRGYFEDARVKSIGRDNEWVRELGGRVLKVVVPLLPRLPSEVPFDVLWIERSLDEVIASQAAMLARQGRPAQPGDLLRKAFTSQSDRARAWLEAGESSGLVRSLVLDHPTVVSDPTAESSRIASWLGMPLDEEAMAGWVDPGLHRIRVS